MGVASANNVSANRLYGFERFILQSVRSSHVKMTFLLKGRGGKHGLDRLCWVSHKRAEKPSLKYRHWGILLPSDVRSMSLKRMSCPCEEGIHDPAPTNPAPGSRGDGSCRTSGVPQREPLRGS